MREQNVRVELHNAVKDLIDRLNGGLHELETHMKNQVATMNNTITESNKLVRDLEKKVIRMHNKLPEITIKYDEHLKVLDEKVLSNNETLTNRID